VTPQVFSPDDDRVRSWLEVREPLERQLLPLGAAVIDELQLVSGERVLDIGCGVGATPHALARAVGPDGQVVGIDVLKGAVDVARVDPPLPANITLIHGDAQVYPFAPASFDVAFSRFGVMFFADAEAAFRNLRRALQPGGRLGFVCWRRLDENELDHLPLRAASGCLPESLIADAAVSAPFSFAEPEEVHRILVTAGFRGVRMRKHDERVGSGSLQAMLHVCSHVGALGKILRERPELRDEALPALALALRALDGPAGPTLRAATWIVTASRGT
jgi:SAM-dependent methyltransferase